LKFWSHPPESNRRPADYETIHIRNSDREKPATPKHIGSLTHWASVGMLVGTQVSDSSSRTKHGQFPSYFDEVRLISSQDGRRNHVTLFKKIRPVRELSVSSKRRRKWKNKQSARGAVMKDARSVRRMPGQNYVMVVANVRLTSKQE
jgi:hypothetical protein